MKKTLSLLLAVVCVVIACFTIGGIKEAEAASNIAGGDCGENMEWWLTTNGVLHIEGKGEMDYWDTWPPYPSPGWKAHKDQVKEVIISKGVTEVGRYAFSGGYPNLTKVTLPSTITKIENDAFSGCVNLKTINIPSAVTEIGGYAFKGCSSLTKITLPSGLKKLAWFAFSETGLTSITVPSKISELSQGAFRNCDSLKSATIGTSTGSYIIGFEAFYGCDNLTTVKIGKAVTEIERYAFMDCPKLSNLTLGSNISVILGRAFGNDVKLTGVTIPNSVKKLDRDNWAYGPFAGCTGLKKVVFGSGLEYIHEKSFDNCVNIKEIYFLGNAPEFGGTETFKGVTATAYYPKGNSTWKQKNLTNHGGFIDWNKIDTFSLEQPTLKVSNNAATGKPVLSWNKMSGAVKYEVYCATSKTGSYKRLITTKSASVTNTSTDIGKTYYYKVRGVNANGVKSKFSEIVSRTCDCARPSVTKSWTVDSSGKPALRWNKVAGASKYEVYRATSKNGTYSKILTTTKTSFTNTSATTGKTYYYKIKAVCSKTTAGNSAYSAVKSVTCDCAKPVVSISRNTSGKPKLSWKKVDGASSYVVYRATSKNGTFTKLGTTTKTNYTNNSAKAGKTYYYKVKAVCSRTSSGNSAYSAVKSITCKKVVTVYIGETGTKYHRESCSTLKGKGTAISLDKAIDQGRTACKVCKP